MPYVTSNLIARQHGWGDDTTGSSIGSTIGGIIKTLLPPAPSSQPVVVSQSSNTMTYVALAAAAGIGIYLWKRKKR